MFGPRPENANEKEWILLFGMPGVGKSTSWLDIASVCQSFGSQAVFHVVDTDRAIRKNVRTFPNLSEIGPPGSISPPGATIRIHDNLNGKPLYGFDDFRRVKDLILKEVQPLRGDWVIVDRASVVWNRVADFYCEHRLGVDRFTLEAEFRQKQIREGRSGDGSALFRHYSNIYNLHEREFEDQLVYGSGCHVLMTAEEGPLSIEGLDSNVPAEIKQALEHLGVKPKCSNKTPSKMHTWLRQLCPYPKTIFLSTGRERDGTRTYLNQIRLQSFAWQYLVDVVGWEIT